MDIKVLRNLLSVARTGSITDAAQQVHVTVQALAAQLNKLEEHCGFKLFERTNKGVSLTPRGVEILPHVMDTVQADERLQLKIRQLREQNGTPLRVALNSTLSVALNQQVMAAVTRRLAGHSLVFGCAETPDNLLGLARGETDIVVVLGDRIPGDLYSVALKGLKVEVVAASAAGDAQSPPVFIKPLPECPYAAIFARFFEQGRSLLQGATVLHSGSEIVSVSMIGSLGGVGVVSRALAEANQLFIWPQCSATLDAWLVMREPLIAEDELPRFCSADASQERLEPFAVQQAG